MDPGTLTTPDKVGEGLAAPRQEPRLRTLVLLTFYSTLCKSYIIILSLLSPRRKDWLALYGRAGIGGADADDCSAEPTGLVCHA